MSITNVTKTALGILLEAALQQPSNRWWSGLWKDRPVRVALENGGNRVRHRLAGECPAARQHLVQDATECPDVGPLVNELAACLLGAHVTRRAQNQAITRVAGGGRFLGCAPSPGQSRGP